MSTVDIKQPFQEEWQPLLRFIKKKVNEPEKAEDIAQEAFTKLLERIQKEEVSRPHALLYKIANDSIKDWYKKKEQKAPLLSLEGLQENTGFEPPTLDEEFQKYEEVSPEERLSTLLQKAGLGALEKEWGGLKNLRIALTSGHRELQILTLLSEIEQKKVEELRQKLGLRMQSSKFMFLENNLFHAPQNSIKPEGTLLLATIFHSQKDYFTFMWNSNPTLRRLGLDSSVGRKGFLAYLLLGNPRVEWLLLSIRKPEERNPAYSMNFIRDYLAYRIHKSGVRISKLKAVLDKFLEQQVKEDQGVQATRPPSEQFLQSLPQKDRGRVLKAWTRKRRLKTFNRRYWFLKDMNQESIKKQQQRIEKKIQALVNKL